MQHKLEASGSRPAQPQAPSVSPETIQATDAPGMESCLPSLDLPRALVLEDPQLFIKQMNTLVTGQALIDFRRFQNSPECPAGVMLELFTPRLKIEAFCCFAESDAQRTAVTVEQLRRYMQVRAIFGLTHNCASNISFSLIPPGAQLPVLKLYCEKGVVSTWTDSPSDA